MELVTIEKGKELEAFSTKGGLDFILDSVKTTLKKRKPDLSTKKGRDEVASFAHQISKLKVKLDDKGKALTDGWRAQTDLVNSSRKHARDTLEELRDKARQPLTDWEQIDKDRIAKHEENLETLRNMVNSEDESASAYAAILTGVKAVKMGNCWEEFAADAAEAKDEAVAVLECAHTAAVKSEADAEELERLRKETAAREQADRDAAIAREATAAAEREAKEAAELVAREAKEREERLRIEKEEAEAKVKQQEEDRIAAEKEAVEVAEAAEERRLGAIEQTKIDEAARVKREADEATAKQERLEANKRHTNKIDKQAVESLKALSVPAFDAIRIVKAIAAGEIANVTINY